MCPPGPQTPVFWCELLKGYFCTIIFFQWNYLSMDSHKKNATLWSGLTGSIWLICVSLTHKLLYNVVHYISADFYVRELCLVDIFGLFYVTSVVLLICWFCWHILSHCASNVFLSGPRSRVFIVWIIQANIIIQQ